MARQKIISNKTLFQHASEMGLPAYIQAKPFALKLWKPLNFQIVPLPQYKDSATQEILSGAGAEAISQDPRNPSDPTGNADDKVPSAPCTLKDTQYLKLVDPALDAQEPSHSRGLPQGDTGLVNSKADTATQPQKSKRKSKRQRQRDERHEHWLGDKVFIFGRHQRSDADQIS